MGCKNSKSATGEGGGELNGQPENVANSIEQDETNIPTGVTQEQKELILDTWKLLVENISNVGVITFMKLFETHPDVQDVFMPFKGLSQDELRHSKELRAHGLRVMGFVQKVVARIDEPDKCENLLRELGKNHVMYGAKIDYVDLIGPQFVFAVKPTLPENWTQEIEDAWLQLFKYIAYIMKSAMMASTTNPPNTQHKQIKL